MVHPTDLWKRDSSQSTATFSSLRSSWRSSNCRRISDDSVPVVAQPNRGSMAAAADASRTRRQPKRQLSQCSLRSVRSSSTTDSFSVSRRNTSEQNANGGPSPQPRNSFNAAFDRAKDFTKNSRVDSNSSKRSSVKAPVRRCETAMRSGRHSNEWVFGGWSLRETVKGFLK